MKVGAPRASGRVELTKWVCRLSNTLGATDDCDNVAALAKKYAAKDHASDAVDEADIENHGPWDALIFAKDPAMMGLIKTLTDAWEAQELEELESIAEEYNLATGKKLASMRKQVKSGAVSQEDHLKRLTKRVAPVLSLVKENAKLKKELEAASAASE